jgi:hypothetical protein
MRSAAALPPLPRSEVATAEEQHLAGMLIDATCGPITWSDYRDDSVDQLMQACRKDTINARIVGIDLVVLGLAAVNGFHVQGVPSRCHRGATR